MNKESPPGATYLGDGRCHFNVWAPLVQNVEVHIMSLEELIVPLKRDFLGYHQAIIEGAG